jgi:hypothetical protein
MKRIETWAAAIACSLGLLVLARVLHRLVLTSVADMNSDSLFLAQFARDVARGTSLRDWIVQPAPSFFPDGVLVGVSQLCSSDIRTSMYVYHSLSLIIFLGALVGIAKTVTGDWLRAAVVVIAPTLPFAIETSSSAMARNFMLPGHHGMSTVMAVVSLLLIVQGTVASNRSRLRIAAFAIIQIGTASFDRLYLLVGILPLIVAVLASASFRIVKWRTVLSTLASLLIALPAPIVFEAGARKFGMFIPATRNTIDWSLGRLVNAIDLLNGHAAAHPVFAWSFALLMIAGPAAAIGCTTASRNSLKRDRTPILGMVMAFFSASVAANVLGVGFGGFLIDPYRVRYLEAAWVLPPFAISILCAGLATRSATTRLASPVLLLAISWLYLRTLPTTSMPVSEIATYSPVTKCIDEAARATGYHHGYATYWNARKQSLLSHEGVEFSQVTADFRVHQWITNLRGHQAIATNEPGFLVYLADMNEADVRSSLGTPASERICGASKLWVYNGTPNRLPSGIIVAHSLTESTLQW